MAEPNNDLRRSYNANPVGHPYWMRGYKAGYRSLTWDELVKEAQEIWGKEWKPRFLEVSKLNSRTLARWKKDGVVRRPMITAMIIAIKGLRANNLNVDGI